jgi:rod shape-determining protein MreB
MFSFFRDDGSAADIYVDLGTANTLIAVRGKGVLVNEPTLIAFSETSPGKRRVIAVGIEAKEKMKNNPGNIFTLRPLKDGVIDDFETTETMLRYFFNRPGIRKSFGRPRVVISLPFGVTEIEKKAVVDAAKSAGAKEVFLIDEPMATAIGSNLPIREPRGSMIIDIGGGTTEVAVIALADIVYCEAAKIGGNKIDVSIVDFLKNKRNLIVSENQAELIKVQYGTACAKKDIRSFEISGRDFTTGLTKTLSLTTEDIGNAMDGAILEIIGAIHKALENTPPELVSDIIESGIVLAGGGALIRDIDLRLQNEIRLPVRLALNPLIAIAKGGEEVLSDPSLLDKILLEY